MTAKIIDGRKVADGLLNNLKKKVSRLKSKPGLAVVLVGNNPASQVYVNMKEKKCADIGFYSKKIILPENTTEEQLLKTIDDLNQDSKIHGMLVQLPLPKHIDEQLIIDSILPHKDADGFNPINMGNLFIGKNIIVPATPKGVIKLIESTGIKLEGKHAVVVGRSNIVGKPIAMLLQQKNCTVTMCHSRTKPLEEYTKQADILVVAIGKARAITKDMVKKGAIVIDVGTNKVFDKLVGDVDFDSVKEVAGYITPVPKGVGPMTIACLMENTLECMELQKRVLE
ncbi:MAG: bifunctional methylenetetrahydrofolate dehydrogenase/methenyltetrahydrofolate cyclohydrolase FolD [Nanoarchaeota archaeon]|nr:bifunctional methylenetetrahydrofolate dehydrogenase/methenyltetrahydrofolate cyclohydrolase FolD [Nanoarchaeota archaeon]MBU1005213.1 bifunctional methylenetetrahydrofolate dehydrogenase/methenyltetrahydrofolate cyclohydrolase FolD [Nanoarchaeota archaeon]MBU1946884.1 bifunctional methylenetetrahydrofolate dehydrogenase/methenyltetrahydrofolate cyclohydrolase FolD [Nanoarchaeota archaeon]